MQPIKPIAGAPGARCCSPPAPRRPRPNPARAAAGGSRPDRACRGPSRRRLRDRAQRGCRQRPAGDGPLRAEERTRPAPRACRAALPAADRADRDHRLSFRGAVAEALYENRFATPRGGARAGARRGAAAAPRAGDRRADRRDPRADVRAGRLRRRRASRISSARCWRPSREARRRRPRSPRFNPAFIACVPAGTQLRIDPQGHAQLLRRGALPLVGRPARRPDLAVGRPGGPARPGRGARAHAPLNRGRLSLLKLSLAMILSAAALGASASAQQRPRFDRDATTPERFASSPGFQIAWPGSIGSAAAPCWRWIIGPTNTGARCCGSREPIMQCVPAGSRLAIGGVLFAGGLAENLLRRGGALADLSGFVALDPARPAIVSRDETELMALCVVRASPAEVSALLQTPPASDGRRAWRLAP